MPLLTFSLILIAALVPGLAWLLFFLREDVHPEPRKLIVYTFGVGIFISTPIIAIQILGRGLILELLPNALVLIFFLALVEEFFKFVAAYVAVGSNEELDEPIDFMIYMVAASLGLATIENFFILSEFLLEGGLEIMSEVAYLMTLRFVGATFLHALASGIVGFYWARTRRKESNRPLFWGIIYATLIHGFFNALILVFQNADYLIYPSLFLLIASVVLFKDFEKLRERSQS